MVKPLDAIIDGNQLVIKITFDHLVILAAEHPDFWNGEDDDAPNIKVTDPAVFAQEVANYLNDEEEDGSTLVTKMFDDGIRAAVEDGCEGIHYDA